MEANTKKRKRDEIVLFQDKRPDLFVLIDRELTKKNGKMTDEQIDLVSYGSDKQLHFRCSQHTTCHEHVWRSTPKYTTLGEGRKFGCPFCNDHNKSQKYVCKCDPRLLSTKRPDIFSQIDRELTKKYEHLSDHKIDRLLVGSNESVYFRCSSHTTCSKHIWRTQINYRTRPSSSDCPFCAKGGNRKRICECSSLYSMFPIVAANWDYKANEQPGPKAISPGSNRLAYWNCKTCDHQWQMMIWQCTRLVRGCPNCSRLAYESVGAEACRKTLIDIKETFVTEGTIPGLRSKNDLYFDFLCPVRSNPQRASVAIEFDGEQHFHFYPIFHRSINQFKQGHLRDLIKNRFCGENRIYLLRIAYSIPTNKIGNVIRRFFSRIETATEGQTIIQYVGKEYNQEYFNEW